jgi:hypothetical protein
MGTLAVYSSKRSRFLAAYSSKISQFSPLALVERRLQQWMHSYTPTAIPATTGYQTEQQIQYSRWSTVGLQRFSLVREPEVYKLEISQRQL